jgi:ubiquinone biosynthesis monooxygenase Coq7
MPLRGALTQVLCLMELTAHDIASNDIGSRIIKVNHAGEHGAVNIYSGQIFMARLTARAMVSELVEFRSHEQRHRALFWAELQRRGRPRCRSYFLCGFGGYVLGLITGLLGSSAIAATTVAVERVVLRHLEQQLSVLQGTDPFAVAAISAIVLEERQHHDRSAAQVMSSRFWSKVLTPIVSASTEAVIWAGMRS